MVILTNYCLYATDYYVSNTGNDGNTGTSTGDAWATIDKVNSMVASMGAGDKILFERDGVFRGTINISVSGIAANPITIGAYGTGNNPVIKGSEVITGWAQSGNIWTADCPDFPESVTNLFINGNFQPLGRYPNDSYLTVTGGSGKSIVIDDALSFPDGHWDNGQIAIKTARWMMDAVKIFSQVGTTISLYENTTYGIWEGFGYFFQNHINALDLEGEWAYDEEQKKIHVFSATDLNSLTIEATKYDYCIKLENANYITIENLELSHARSVAIRAHTCEHINFSNNIITYSGGNGIHIRYCNNSVFDNNTIYYTNNNGFDSYYSNNVELTNNVIKHAGYIPGRGWNDNHQYTGIYISDAEDFLIEYNVVDTVGFNGISFYFCSDVIMKNNFINYYSFVKDDAAGIYTWGTQDYGNKIIGNIILNGIGAPEGTDHPDSYEAFGIYLDDNTKYVFVEDNTVAFASYFGIFVHSSDSCIVTNNTVFDNLKGQLALIRKGGALNIDDCKFDGNYLFSIGKNDQWVIFSQYVLGENEFTNNTICDPYDEQIIYESHWEPFEVLLHTITDWQAIGNVSDKPIPFTWAQSGLPDTIGFVNFYYNASKDSKEIALSGTYRDLDNNIVIGSYSLDPFSSVILLKENRELLGNETTPDGEIEFCQRTETTQYTTVGTLQADTYTWFVSPGSAGLVEGTGKTVNINWDPTFSGECNISFTASGPSNYSAISPPLTVNVSPGPDKPEKPVGPDSLFQNSPESQYSTIEVEGATSYEWSINPSNAGEVFGLGNTCGVQWNEPFFGTAYLRVRAQNDCGFGNYSDSLLMKIVEAELGYGIINIFTPNGDGYNDYWNIPFIRDFPDAIIKIFDRQNKLLVEYRGSDSSWNGTVNGELVPMGNYLYVIQIGQGKQPIKGYVTVLR